MGITDNCMDHVAGITLLLAHIAIAILLMFSSMSPELYKETTNVTVAGSYVKVGENFLTNDCMFPDCGDHHGSRKREERACLEQDTNFAELYQKYNKVHGMQYPTCGAKPAEDASHSDKLIIAPEYHSVYMQEMGNGFNFDGEFKVETKSIMPIQCSKDYFNPRADQDHLADDKITPIPSIPTDSFWVESDDCENLNDDEQRKCRENICEYFFYQTQQNAALLTWADANEDMQDMCWLPRTSEDINSDGVASDFMKRSKLEVSVYPLKNGASIAQAKTDAAKVCSLTFVIGRKTPKDVNTDDDFKGFIQDQRYVVCYHDVDESDSAKNLFGSRKDSITSTAKFDETALYKESQHLSVFWALFKHLDGYKEPGTAWVDESFLDKQIHVPDGTTILAGCTLRVLSAADNKGIEEVEDSKFTAVTGP